jgi:hypothetical protein
VKVEKRGKRRRAHASRPRESLCLPYFDGFCSEGAVDGAVLAGDLHLEDDIGLLPGGGAGVGEKGNETSLEGSEAALDFALCLRSGSNKMCNAETSEGSLKLADGIAVIAAGTWSEEAQAVGINNFGEPPFFEGLPKVLEMVPRRIGGYKPACEVESRVIVGGEQESLLGGGGPPLVDGTIVLPEFADVRPTEASIEARFTSRRRHEVGIVRLDVCLHRGAGAKPTTEALKFVSDQLIVGRVL